MYALVTKIVQLTGKSGFAFGEVIHREANQILLLEKVASQVADVCVREKVVGKCTQNEQAKRECSVNEGVVASKYVTSVRACIY